MMMSDDAGQAASRGPIQPEPAGPALYAPRPEDEVSLLEYVNVLLKRWRTVVGVPLLAGFVAGLYSLLTPPMFTATTAFVPEVGSRGRIPSGLAGLATQFGVSVGAEASQSPRFYAEVVKSHEIMERVLLDRYEDPRARENPGDSATLLDILDLRGSDLSKRVDAGLKALGGLVSTRVDAQTGIVRLSVQAPYPELAAEVANRFVQYLNEFNAKTRQSQARERRKFVEERIAEAERELRRAEEDLKTFYERNRSWQQSPHLVFEEGRLRRQVEIRQEVYLTLKREYETARIEEVNDTPVITVIDPAVPPQQRSKPRRRLNVILALLLGGMVGVFWAFGAEYVDRVQRDGNEEYRQFRELVGRARDDVGNMLRGVTRRSRRE